MKEGSDLYMTFSEFVATYTRDMQQKLKHNTWLTKEHIVRTKLLPYFKDKKMRGIKPKDIIQWQNKQISYRDEKGKPYTPTYLKTLQSELSALFNHAIRFYELKSNPVKKAGQNKCYSGQKRSTKNLRKLTKTTENNVFIRKIQIKN